MCNTQLQLNKDKHLLIHNKEMFLKINEILYIYVNTSLTVIKGNKFHTFKKNSLKQMTYKAGKSGNHAGFSTDLCVRAEKVSTAECAKQKQCIEFDSSNAVNL